MANKEYKVSIILDLDTGGVIKGGTELKTTLEKVGRDGAASAGRGAKAAHDSHVKAFKATEREATKSAKEVQRINDQTRRQAEQNDRLMERANKSLNDARIREARRSANEISRSLNSIKVDAVGSRVGVLSSQFRNLASAISPVSLSLAGLATGGISLALAAVRSATELESLKRGLVAVSGSSEEAERQLVRLREVAKLPGLNFREAIEGSIRLQAAGVSAALAERSIKGFGNALATVGKGSAELEGVIRALSQIQSKGKVQAEEINQIAERLPQIRVLMQAAFGTARTEDIQKLKLSATGFLEALVAQLEKLPRVTSGSQTAFENLQDAAFIALSQIGEKMLPPVVKAVEDLTVGVEQNGGGWKRLGDDLADFIKGTRKVIDALQEVGRWLTWAEDRAGNTGRAFREAVLPKQSYAGRAWDWLTGQDAPPKPLYGQYASSLYKPGWNPQAPMPTPSLPKTTTPAPNFPAATGKRKAEQRIIDDADEWRLSELKEIQEFFQRATGKALPFRAGQTGYHNRKGWDHSNAADVHLNPSSPEGKLLMNYLRATNVPFIPSTGKEPWSTGAHIHVGARSRSFASKNTKNRRVVSRRETRLDDLLDVPLFDPRTGQPTGEVVQASRYDLDTALSALLERQFSKEGRAQGVKYIGAVRPSEGGLGAFGGADRLSRQLTSAEQSRRAKDDEYFGHYEETSKGVFERVGGAYKTLIDRQINLQGELDDVHRDALLERKNRELDLIVNLERAEARLADLRMDAADDQLTEQRRLLAVRQEEISLTERLQQLQDESATTGANAGLRQQIALMEELNALKRADIDAVESQIRSQARLADAGVLHTEQVRAAVLDHMAQQKTVTESFGDSIIGVYDRVNDLIGRGVSKLTGGIRELDGILTSIIRQVTNRLFQRFLDMVFPSANSSTGQQSGSIFSNIFGGGMTGGFSGGSGAGGMLGNAGGGLSGIIRNLFGGGASIGGSALSAPQSISAAAGASSGSLAARLLGGFGGVGGASGGARAAGFSFGGLGASLGGSLGALAPLMGLMGGAGLGGRAGGIMGTIGGGILGGIGGLLGGGALLTSITGVGAFSSMGALSGFAPLLGAMPFLAPIAGALLLGGIIHQRNVQRRRDETTRNTAGTDIRAKLYDLIAQVRSDRIDGSQALEQYQSYRAEYVQQTQALKDSKTRNHAMLWLTRDLEGQVLPKLHEAIRNQGSRKSISGLLHPTFANGGAVWQRFADGGAMQPFIGRVNGSQRTGDPYLIRVNGDETVVNSVQRQRLGGAPAMAAAGVPGYEGAQASAAPLVLRIERLEVVMTEGGAASVIMHGLKTSDGRRAVAEIADSRVKVSALRRT